MTSRESEGLLCVGCALLGDRASHVTQLAATVGALSGLAFASLYGFDKTIEALCSNCRAILEEAIENERRRRS